MLSNFSVSPHVAWWRFPPTSTPPLGERARKARTKASTAIKVFVDDNSGKAKRVIVQVKSGHVKSGDIRDLVGTLRREGGAIGVFITLERATSHMTDEAASAGIFTSEHFGKFPRIQILTIEDLLAGKTLHLPPSLERTFKLAKRVSTESKDQVRWDLIDAYSLVYKVCPQGT
ncbi:MAG: restriction endonuclease [Pyrinomonadaceae bacterium]